MFFLSSRLGGRAFPKTLSILEHILVLHSGYLTRRAELFDRASKVMSSPPKTKPRRSLTTSYSYHSVFFTCINAMKGDKQGCLRCINVLTSRFQL